MQLLFAEHDKWEGLVSAYAVFPRKISRRKAVNRLKSVLGEVKVFEERKEHYLYVWSVKLPPLTKDMMLMVSFYKKTWGEKGENPILLTAIGLNPSVMKEYVQRVASSFGLERVNKIPPLELADELYETQEEEEP